MTIDIERLYQDLMNYFGTSPFGWKVGVLADIQSAFERQNYQRVVDLAVAEGFDLSDYEV